MTSLFLVALVSLCVCVHCWRGCERAMYVRMWYVTLFLCLHRVILRSSSDTGSNPYDYYIGICTVPNPELVKKDDDCMVIQKNSSRSSVHGICLGRKSGAQLTDTLSKCLHMSWLVYLQDFSAVHSSRMEYVEMKVWSIHEMLCYVLSFGHVLCQL